VTPPTRRTAPRGGPKHLPGRRSEADRTASVRHEALLLLHRTLSRCEQVGECWVWTGAVSSSGYAAVRWRGQTLLAHRLVASSDGLLIEGLDVHHLCANRRCCRPDHLAVLTRRQHVRVHGRWARAKGVGR